MLFYYFLKLFFVKLLQLFGDHNIPVELPTKRLPNSLLPHAHSDLPDGELDQRQHQLQLDRLPPDPALTGEQRLCAQEDDPKDSHSPVGYPFVDRLSGEVAEEGAEMAEDGIGASHFLKLDP